MNDFQINAKVFNVKPLANGNYVFSIQISSKNQNGDYIGKWISCFAKHNEALQDRAIYQLSGFLSVREHYQTKEPELIFQVAQAVLSDEASKGVKKTAAKKQTAKQAEKDPF